MAKKKMSSKARQKAKMTQQQRMVFLPNPMHLSACQEGAKVYRNRKKYTRKGKERFDARKWSD